MSLLETAVMGFVIGLTGAVAPGPTLIATIRCTISRGWSSGPLVTCGHIIGEAVLIILIAAGIPYLPPDGASSVAVIGGIALILFGILTVKSGRDATFRFSSGEYDRAGSPILSGLITSISNPYFWIWWFSVGSALVISSLLAGISGLIAFVAGHWLADLSWYTLVSVGIHKSRVFLGDSQYRFILIGCGIILVIFGLYFLLSSLSIRGTF